MSEEISSIYAPSLYWFAYQYHKGLVVSKGSPRQESLKGIDAQWVNQRYQQILSAFEIELELPLRQDKPDRDFEMLQTSNLTGRQYQYFTTKDEQLAGFIYPQSVHDCYALNLNVFSPENPVWQEYRLADLGKLNPKNCFQPNPNPPQGDAGQTLLMTAYVASPPPANIRDWDGLAQQCWLNFFHPDKPELLPPLYRAYSLLGGYLYEYGNPRKTLQENPYGHLLVWLLCDESPTLVLQKFYWQLPELFLYYHKIARTFQDSRGFYDQADEIVAENETELNKFNETYLKKDKPDSLGDEDLQKLKLTLKKLLKTSLAYSQELRNLEYARNTIAINAKNYQGILEQMEQLAQMPLTAFRVFLEKEAIAFQDKIQADLNYFNQGSSLLDRAIATIRGLVEVDQAERDRQRQQQEKERDRKEQTRLQEAKETAKKEQNRQAEANQKLQDQIQAIGVGIAAGAIVASTSGLIFEEPFSWPWQSDRGDRLHPVTIAILVSVAFAVVSWVAATGLIWCFRKSDRTSQQNQKHETTPGDRNP